MACEDPGGAKCAGTWTASGAGVMALSGSDLAAAAANIQRSTILREKRNTINSYSYLTGTYQHCPGQSRTFVTLLISCQVELRLLLVSYLKKLELILVIILGGWVYSCSSGEAEYIKLNLRCFNE